ncbi:MAG: hypothetical protein ACREDF_05850 [Thermoplasmata archaeon]
MILGYVDSEDRIYDLNFATLRMRVRVESGPAASGDRIMFSQVAGAGAASYRVLGEIDVSAEVSMDHDGHRVPLLRPVEGHLYRHEAGLLFFASPTQRDPEDPGFFLVKLRAMPSAVRFFFEDREGREMISIPQDEILRTEEEADGITVYVSAASVALPKEKIAYAVQLRPAERVAPLLSKPGPARR